MNDEFCQDYFLQVIQDVDLDPANDTFQPGLASARNQCFGIWQAAGSMAHRLVARHFSWSDQTTSAK